MSFYYPQGSLTLKVRWEDFGSTDSSLQEVYELRILARNINVEINDYTEADTFSAEIDYNSFPFDPRNIRSCGVTAHIKDQQRIFDGNTLNLMQPEESNIVFTGFVDEESIVFDDNSRIVRMEGRDFTSLFLDRKRLNVTPLNLTLPIDQIITNLIKEQKAAEKIEVDVRIEESLPILSELASDFNPVTSVKNPKRNETYWDIMQAILEKSGLIGYMDLDKFVITKPRVLFNKARSKQFIYGKNVTKIEFKRKLGRQKGFNIKVVSIDIGGSQVVEALVPKEAKSPDFIEKHGNVEVTIEQLDKDGKKIEPKTADYLVFKIPDVVDKDHLITVGEDIFEEISRQELEGSLSTREMLIPELIDQEGQRSNPISFDQIRVGTAIQIFLEQSDMEKMATITNFAQKKKFLLLRGFPDSVADALGKSTSKSNSSFYVKSVSYKLSQDEGFEMDIKFINYIELEKKFK